MTATLEGGEWSAACPGRTLPLGKTRYPLYRRLGWPQGLSGRAENLVPTGIPSRTVQPVAQWLHRLSYPAHERKAIVLLKINAEGNMDGKHSQQALSTSGVLRNFFSVGGEGVQQMQLRTENRENGDLGA